MSFSKNHPTLWSHASESTIYWPLVLGKARTGGDIKFSIRCPTAASFYFSNWKRVGSPFFKQSLIGAKILVTFSKNRPNNFKGRRKDRIQVTVVA